MMETGLRIGKVSNIDYESGMLQVVYTDKGNAVTTKIPYANFNKEYAMPHIGQQVLVGHLTNGSSRGVVLCTMWNKKDRPSEAGKGLYRKDLSAVADAAYIRFEEESGEYLLKSPIIMLHGIEQTDLEGPKLNIAANIESSFESPAHEMKIKNVCVSGLEDEDIETEIRNNIKIVMDMADLEALIKNVKIETAEELRWKAENASIEAKTDIKLEDREFSTTLSDILKRLEALDKNKSARKLKSC